MVLLQGKKEEKLPVKGRKIPVDSLSKWVGVRPVYGRFFVENLCFAQGLLGMLTGMEEVGLTHIYMENKTSPGYAKPGGQLLHEHLIHGLFHHAGTAQGCHAQAQALVASQLEHPQCLRTAAEVTGNWSKTWDKSIKVPAKIPW